MKVLVTGGAGYIGSTVCSALLDAGVLPVILDSLVTGRRDFAAGRVFYEGDVGDGDLLDRIFRDHRDIGAAIHCAAYIVVAESVADPLKYYENNVANSVRFIQGLRRNGCGRLIFSSSAAVYGTVATEWVDEAAPVAPASPYARTKAIVDRILADSAAAGQIRAVSLRYFNPVGADPLMRSGLVTQTPSHALGKMIEAWQAGTKFAVTGADWPTRDGTGLRDYIHVWDLAQAHVATLRRFDEIVPGDGGPAYEVINLGTGAGTTVRELAAAFSQVVGQPLPTYDAPRRAGDSAGVWCRTERASRMLGWVAKLDLRDGIDHALRWRSRAPRESARGVAGQSGTRQSGHNGHVTVPVQPPER